MTSFVYCNIRVHDDVNASLLAKLVKVVKIECARNTHLTYQCSKSLTHTHTHTTHKYTHICIKTCVAIYLATQPPRDYKLTNFVHLSDNLRLGLYQ